MQRAFEWGSCLCPNLGFSFDCHPSLRSTRSKFYRLWPNDTVPLEWRFRSPPQSSILLRIYTISHPCSIGCERCASCSGLDFRKKPRGELPNIGMQLRSRKSISASSTSKTTSKEEPVRERASSIVPGQVSAYISEENFLDFLYRPHTLSGLVIVCSVIAYAAFGRIPSNDPSDNVKWGLACMAFVFLLYCMLHFRDSLLVRPHPALWRIVSGAAILYLMILIFTLTQRVDDIRSWLRYVHPDLGQPLAERSYGEDCRILTFDREDGDIFFNLKETFVDEFILAHLIGWFGKALILRDRTMCWIISISFELMEISFQHWLPNFRECWWDHVIVDIFLCNLIGMHLGLWFNHVLEVKSYNWTGWSDLTTRRSKAKRLIRQFLPFSWTKYEWDMFASYKRFFCVNMVPIAASIIELNAFFLKYVLWIPPTNNLNIYRLCLIFMLSIPTSREFYQYVTDPQTKRFGHNSWLFVAICTSELLITIKFGKGMFTQPFPEYIVNSWLTFFILLSAWAIVYFTCRHLLHINEPADEHSTRMYIFAKWVTHMLFYVCWLPIIYMFFAGMPDLLWPTQWTLS